MEQNGSNKTKRPNIYRHNQNKPRLSKSDMPDYHPPLPALPSLTLAHAAAAFSQLFP